jgi:hypothetical protein
MEGRVIERKGMLTAAVTEVRKKATGELVAIGRQWMSASKGQKVANSRLWLFTFYLLLFSILSDICTTGKIALTKLLLYFANILGMYQIHVLYKLNVMDVVFYDTTK